MTRIPRQPKEYVQGEEAKEYLSRLEASLANPSESSLSSKIPILRATTEEYIAEMREEFERTGRIEIVTKYSVYRAALRLLHIAEQTDPKN